MKRRYKNTIYLLAGIIAGILLGTVLLGGSIANAKTLRELNTDEAVEIAIENYEQYHIHPMVVAAILNGESQGGTAGNGKPYGMIGRRFYDITSATFAFLNLIRYNEWYGDSWKYDDWRVQLYSIEAHGYCTSTSVEEYISYIYDVIDTFDLTKYEEKFNKYLEEKECERQRRREARRAKREKKMRYWIRKGRQRGMFRIKYKQGLLPWQIITDPDYISGGTVLIGMTWCDVVSTKKGIGRTIWIGDHMAYWGQWIRLGEVVENAVG